MKTDKKRKLKKSLLVLGIVGSLIGLISSVGYLIMQLDNEELKPI